MAKNWQSAIFTLAAVLLVSSFLAIFAISPVFAALAPSTPVVVDTTATISPSLGNNTSVAAISQPVSGNNTSVSSTTNCPTCAPGTTASVLNSGQANKNFALLNDSDVSCLSGVPSNYSNKSGLGLWWAWASPCDGSPVCYGGQQLVAVPDYFRNGSSSNGWRYANSSEWANKPEVTFFGTQSNFLCASHWFDPMYDRCDWSDASAGRLSSNRTTNLSLDYPFPWNDSWFVHDPCISNNTTNVTAPTAIMSQINNLTSGSIVYSNGRLIGWAKVADGNSSTLTVYYKWYLNGALNTSGSLAGVPNNTRSNIANITSGLVAGQNWTFEITAFDGTLNSTPLNSSQVTINPCNNTTVSSNSTNLTISYADGWNLLSLPVMVSNNATTAIWPEAASSLFAYVNSYVDVNNAEVAHGYWLKFNGNVNHTYNGTNVSFVNMSINNRWNLVGAISTPINISDVKTEPAGILSSGFFAYSNGYQVTNTLQPGMAYWVKASQAGRIILGTASSSQVAATNLAGLGSVQITDSNKGNTKLYFGNSALPALPPKSSFGFDARYTTDNYIESLPASGYKDYNISISTTAYPVKLQFNTQTGYTYTLSYTSGGVLKSSTLTNTGSATITDPTVQTVTLRVTKQTVVPPKSSGIAQ